jgi:hypothetical protein
MEENMIENEVPKNSFIANEDVEFNIDFYIEDKENIVIFLDEIEIPQYLYDVSKFTNSNGAKITFNMPIRGVVVISRTTALFRSVRYNNTLNNINPDTLNNDFDRVYRIFQEQQLRINNIVAGVDTTDYLTILLANINTYKEKL